uniref:Uncharacterized protein n=1 Tax=Bionectria ochroleuca TaxID=29856 RepID=A0A8H7NKQ5_BIOOC
MSFFSKIAKEFEGLGLGDEKKEKKEKYEEKVEEVPPPQYQQNQQNYQHTREEHGGMVPQTLPVVHPTDNMEVTTAPALPLLRSILLPPLCLIISHPLTSLPCPMAGDLSSTSSTRDGTT